MSQASFDLYNRCEMQVKHVLFMPVWLAKKISLKKVKWLAKFTQLVIRTKIHYFNSKPYDSRFPQDHYVTKT